MKIKISHILLTIITFINIFFIFGIGTFVNKSINVFKTESIRFVKDINNFEKLYKDSIVSTINKRLINSDTTKVFVARFINKNLQNTILNINSVRTDTKYNCNEIFIYDVKNDSIYKIFTSLNTVKKELIESQSTKNFREDYSEKNQMFIKIFKEEKDDVESYADENGYHISKFYYNKVKNKKYVLCIEFDSLNSNSIKNYVMISFAIVLILIMLIVIFGIHSVYNKILIVDRIFKRYINRDFVITDREKSLLKSFTTSKIEDISIQSSNVFNMIDTIENFKNEFSSGKKLSTVSEFFHTIFQESPIGIIVIDSNNKITNINIVGKTMYESCKNHNITDCIVDLTDKNEIYLNINGNVLRISKKEIGENSELNTILILDDITKERDLQNKLNQTINDLKDSNEMLINYSHLISHDIKSPLRTINIFSQKAFSEKDEIKKKEYSKLVKKSISRINDIITDSLNFSKLNNKYIELKSVNVSECINDVLDILSESILLDNVDVKCNVDDSVCLNGNKGLVVNMLQNIISNAIKFNSNVEKVIEINVEQNIISIKDNGIGISKDYMDKIFDTFYRADSTYEGTGLGLSIVKKIADKFNILIDIDSQVGIGTEFKLNF